MWPVAADQQACKDAQSSCSERFNEVTRYIESQGKAKSRLYPWQLFPKSCPGWDLNTLHCFIGKCSTNWATTATQPVGVPIFNTKANLKPLFYGTVYSHSVCRRRPGYQTHETQKGRWKQHQSSDHHIQKPADHFWGYVDGILSQCSPPTRSKFTIVQVLLTFLGVCKFTTFLTERVYLWHIVNEFKRPPSSLDTIFSLCLYPPPCSEGRLGWSCWWCVPWMKFFLLARCILASPPRGGRSHLRDTLKLVQARITKWRSGGWLSLWC